MRGYGVPWKEILTDPALAISFAALIVSLTSVVVGYLIWAADHRQKQREATLQAWLAWSTSSQEDRKTVHLELGPYHLSDELGRCLVESKPCPGLPGPGSKEREAALTALVSTLNGLERMAIGVQLGLYDARTLNVLGGTIIVRQYQRAEGYIRARRTSPDERLRQAEAYSSLEQLTKRLTKSDDTQIDARRLGALRRKAARVARRDARRRRRGRAS